MVDEAVSRYGNIMSGINAAAERPVRRQVEGRSVHRQHHRVPVPRRQAQGKGHRPVDAPQDLNQRREAALAISDAAKEFWGWGLTPNQSGDGYGFVIQRDRGPSAATTPTRPARSCSSTRRRRSRPLSGSARPTTATASMPPCCRRASKAGATPATTRHGSPAGSAIRRTPSPSTPQSKRDKNPVFKNMVLLRAPRANNGDSRDGGNVGGWLTIFKGAPNVDLAKKLALRSARSR